MTYERMYRGVCEMLREYDLHTGSRAAEDVMIHSDQWATSDYFPFYREAAELLIQCREKMDGKTTPATVLAACKRIAKNGYNPSQRGIFRHGGKFCICDGYRAIRLRDDLASLPHVDWSIDLDQVVAPALDAADELLTLPKVAELKAWIAAERTKHGAKQFNRCPTPYQLEDGTYCNPCYLLDMLEALPGCLAYKPQSHKSPIYFCGKNGDGILCPVNPRAAESAA